LVVLAEKVLAEKVQELADRGANTIDNHRVALVYH
jgi:hypothetical protein